MLIDAMQKALAADIVRPVIAVEIQWPGENTRAHSGVGDLYLNTQMVWTPDYNGATTKVVIPPFLPESDFELELTYYRTTASGGNFILCQVNDEEAEDAYGLNLYASGDFENGEGRISWFSATGEGASTSESLHWKTPCKIKLVVKDNQAQWFIDDQLDQQGSITQPAHRGNETLACLGRSPTGGSWVIGGQIHSCKMTDLSEPENNRHYASLIRSDSRPDTLTLKDGLGNGDTDGELVGFTEHQEWLPVTGFIPGDTLFRGVGNLGSISTIKQQSGDSPTRLTLGLSSFDDSVRGEVLRAQYHGRPVRVWLVALDEVLQSMATQLIWRGSIIDASISVGDNNQIEIVVSNRLEDWDKKRPDRFTDESQQVRHPGDRIFRYIPIMAEWPIYWGSDKTGTPLRDSL